MNGLLKFITCGSVDDGKSTLIGHILYDCKLLYTDQEQALMLDSRVGSRGGAIDYSLLLDGLMAEREQGITIDVAYRYFTTDERSFIVADTPGHEEYTRNMAVGASFADLAVILLDASQGVVEQTRRHARICSLMGIRFFVFAVNKMDLVAFKQEPFESIEKEILALQEELGLENCVIVPVSATEGDNVTEQSNRMPWYTGKTLLDYLETVDVRTASKECGFYLPIQRVCRPNHSFRGFQGQVEAGAVHVGQKVTALPSYETAVVKQIYVAGTLAETAEQGQPVTIQLDREVDLSRGCVLESNANLTAAKSFETALLWMDDMPLSCGTEYWFKLGTKLLPGVITNIQYKININSGKHQAANSLTKNEIAVCRVTLSQEAVLSEFQKHKALGELILIDRVSYATAACGVVEKVYMQEKEGTVLSDGSQQVTVQLFDEFYYVPQSNMIVRYPAQGAVYTCGDDLPLCGASYTYPQDFDLQVQNDTANIRGGCFAGFGVHTDEVPFLNQNGICISGEQCGEFGAYRRVAVLKKASVF